MYYFHVYSKRSLFYSSKKINSSVELVNNTNFDFDYVDKIVYQIYLIKDSKLINILV